MMLGFEDFKHAILPIIRRQVQEPGTDRIQIISDAVITFQKLYGFDDAMRDRLMNDLRTNFNTTSTLPSILRAKTGYEPWLDAKKGTIEWSQWSRYRDYLRTVKGWPEFVVDRLDETSDHILDMLADPMIENRSFDRRGLAMGYVQSGKTANFTAVINKAFDAGFKVVIVLAGMHNNLRSQTQLRLDEEVIGYTMKNKHIVDRHVGVGLLTGYPHTDVYSLTSSDQNGDFNARKASTEFKPPILLVVKKNKSVLTSLRNYLRTKSKYAEKVDGKPYKVIRDLPLLMIDDEADQATVNTATIYEDDDYTLNPEYDPSTINGLIREVFETFERRAYVGYTATPFANMLIDRDSQTETHGYDLFPRDFIIGLPKPSNYVGPAEYFGIYDSADKQQASLIRKVEQDEKFIPIAHKQYHVPAYLPEDLVESIYSFLIATAIRRLRGQKTKHSSMLVHVTRFKAVQSRVTRMIAEKVQEIKDSVIHGMGATEHDDKIKAVYEDSFLVKSAARNDGGDTFGWPSVRAEIADVFDKPLHVKEINGDSSDVLDYEEHKEGLYVIAVGGDKLSRGLTLEGLTVSYYLRTSQVYDTLMQMGRWFGYRDGYLDLCRIYTTEELCNYFYAIAMATEELRAQLDDMAERNMTPEEYELQISAYPDLRITSPNKMQAALSKKVSYSGYLVQSTVFENSKSFFATNYKATERFIQRLSEACPPKTGWGFPLKPVTDGKVGYYYWQDVPTESVLLFLTHYQTEKSLKRVDTDSLRQYIQQRTEDGELTEWTVALMSTGDGPESVLAGLPVRPVTRKGDTDYSAGSSTLSIRILTSEGHEYLDFAEGQFNEAKELLKQNDQPTSRKKEKASLYAKARALRSVEKGLLLLYPLSMEADGVLKMAKAALSLTEAERPIGFAISFPKSDKAVGASDYWFNRSVAGEQ